VFRVVFENFYLNKELFYLINHNRHSLLDAFFSKFYPLIAYLRIYLGAHFPLDVFAGALIGIFSFLLALRLA
jgi:hypothetical protein